ncbi:hypothetical protein CL6EHI_083640 [Entamoeba histolytica]|uniref:Uncharacterized protein n=4 Tax=Entamoeba histolytica TaxID=5759 RepID=C4M948_ENTH1|nr:hypothetical protein EHI_083640 [Entamoeba histolytica HM-1:IMSS]EAL49033.1 hypothetical protein EHI_083640 [Entamoeba histolytica HM-1:IMSS]EMD48422.1 Hypothetical protein EHI5A_037200 [Entamoeba histolytica KU27]ENY61486.1 hypothetical protein EHI7A_126080 [Entamoeba histolytica HM-1:IMSS-A]GAT98169.1 hypothetical protein CL6EHI_083640 [Entamoeba histolytica]|eukprot:XP_654425.1 hypothetical protein EHI_083640 [Entamoeba histolytica HM-1:IMSS]
MVWLLLFISTIYANNCENGTLINSLPSSFSVYNFNTLYIDDVPYYGILTNIHLSNNQQIVISTCDSTSSIATYIYEIINCWNNNELIYKSRSSGGCGIYSRYSFSVEADKNYSFFICSKVQSSFSLLFFNQEDLTNIPYFHIQSLPFYHENEINSINPSVNEDCIHDEYGYWYTFKGDGNQINISLCNSFSNFDTLITIMKATETNGVISKKCLLQDYNGCNENGLSFLQLNTTYNTLYYIFISSVHKSIGSYFLQITPYKKQFFCQNPRKTVLPQTISTTIAQDDPITIDPSGNYHRGLWMTMDGYNLMIYIDACPTTDLDCHVILTSTLDCVKEQTLTYNTERGNGFCSASFYGKSSQTYRVKASSTNATTCNLHIQMYETNEVPQSYNIWLLICTAIFGALIIITATSSIIYAIIKKKRMKASIPDVELQVITNK